MKRINISFIFLILPLIFMPLKWFSNMRVDPVLFDLTDVNGINVLFDNGLRIGLIFILVIIIQLLSLKCNMVKYSILSKILLCIVLGLYPFTYYGNFDLIKNYFFKFYSIGFYLSFLSILISIIGDILNKNILHMRGGK
ncbi:MAG: hypothetical protein SO206_02610 [Bacilli bacterium]|nr:hypothetical protein [Bacilli bacterium]